MKERSYEGKNVHQAGHQSGGKTFGKSCVILSVFFIRLSRLSSFFGLAFSALLRLFGCQL